MRLRFLSVNLEGVLSLLGLSGIAVLFLPFVYGVSPWGLISNSADFLVLNTFVMILPALLALPISLASLLLVITGRLPRLGWFAGYGLAFAAAGNTLFMLVSYSLETFFEWILILAPTALLITGVGVVIRNLRLGLSHERNAIIAMQATYLAYASFWVIGFVSDGFPSLQIGFYVLLFTMVVYLAHIVLEQRLAQVPSKA